MTLTVQPIDSLQACINDLGDLSAYYATTQHDHERNCQALVSIEQAIDTRCWRAVAAGITALRPAVKRLGVLCVRPVELAAARTRWLSLLDDALRYSDECETLDELDGIVAIPTRPRPIWSRP